MIDFDDTDVYAEFKQLVFDFEDDFDCDDVYGEMKEEGFKPLPVNTDICDKNVFESIARICTMGILYQPSLKKSIAGVLNTRKLDKNGQVGRDWACDKTGKHQGGFKRADSVRDKWASGGLYYAAPKKVNARGLEFNTMIIDVDIKKGADGLASLAKLEHDIGFREDGLKDMAQVRSGSGGLHIYVLVDGDYYVNKIQESYPDIDFITVSKRLDSGANSNYCVMGGQTINGGTYLEPYAYEYTLLRSDDWSGEYGFDIDGMLILDTFCISDCLVQVRETTARIVSGRIATNDNSELSDDDDDDWADALRADIQDNTDEASFRDACNVLDWVQHSELGEDHDLHYDDWMKIGAILQRLSGDYNIGSDAFEAFDYLSKRSSKYNSEYVIKKWDEVNRSVNSGGAEVGTIFHFAQQGKLSVLKARIISACLALREDGDKYKRLGKKETIALLEAEDMTASCYIKEDSAMWENFYHDIEPYIAKKTDHMWSGSAEGIAATCCEHWGVIINKAKLLANEEAAEVLALDVGDTLSQVIDGTAKLSVKKLFYKQGLTSFKHGMYRTTATPAAIVTADTRTAPLQVDDAIVNFVAKSACVGSDLSIHDTLIHKTWSTLKTELDIANAGLKKGAKKTLNDKFIGVECTHLVPTVLGEVRDVSFTKQGRTKLLAEDKNTGCYRINKVAMGTWVCDLLAKGGDNENDILSETSKLNFDKVYDYYAFVYGKANADYMFSIARHIAFNPEKRLTFLTIIKGDEGVGKSVFIKAILNMFDQEFIYGSLKSSEMQTNKFASAGSDFFDSVVGKVVCANHEIDYLEYDDTFKTLIESDSFKHSVKSVQKSVYAQNTATYIGATNREMPLRTNSGSRRLFIVLPKAGRREIAKYVGADDDDERAAVNWKTRVFDILKHIHNMSKDSVLQFALWLDGREEFTLINEHSSGDICPDFEEYCISVARNSRIGNFVTNKIIDGSKSPLMSEVMIQHDKLMDIAGEVCDDSGKQGAISTLHVLRHIKQALPIECSFPDENGKHITIYASESFKDTIPSTISETTPEWYIDLKNGDRDLMSDEMRELFGDFEQIE